MSRRVRYKLAVSLDGFIAGPKGEYDWIVADPSVDFAALYREFDTVVMGRKTFELVVGQNGSGAMPGLEVIAFSRTLPGSRSPGVRVVNEDPTRFVADLKEEPGRDIWLFGGGQLFRSLLDAKLVDTVELGVMPVLLGAGVPLVPPAASGAWTKLVLSDVKSLPASGIVAVTYSVEGGAAAPSVRRVKRTPTHGSAKRKSNNRGRRS